ncbi:hypothetical protein HS961_13485 [Comamonas piscis]|uniref:Uncharacterized protein n=1 Tax=Comamonas piscis TaxID=1562974 RepID=A0A7G5EID4_9BURK|nr:hypothetical protein [Comamonas piscis]QMV73759.1 hypothetical protein HS961_13485 [Comamonas piscis]WSO32183.1 hypothetical protein VUJ63_13525 [Comamonas piscis]
MSLSERRGVVIGLWRAWRQNMRDLSDGWFPYYDTGKQVHLFYEYLQANHPHLLDMPGPAYDTMKMWVFDDMEA